MMLKDKNEIEKILSEKNNSDITKKACISNRFLWRRVNFKRS